MAGPGPEELARHQRFLLRLALRLAGPEVEAEDLVQEVYVQALERPPAEQASVRGWLATVLRRSAGRSARGALRRSDREALAARPERAGGEPSIDARIELQSALLAHLRELPAGEREALFLRYADDLTPPEIAARLDVSLETVRTRLRRGRQRLRARLDARPGGRAAWCALLLRAPRAPLSPITGAPAGVGVALLMTTTAKVLLGAAACAAAALFVLRPTRSPREPAALDPGSRGERIATTALATPASELPAPRRADPGESGPAAAVEIELAPARPAASPWPVLVRAEDRKSVV